MRNYKQIELPDPEETIKECLAHPEQAEALLIKYGFETIAIQEANRMREEAMEKNGELGPDLELKKMRPVTLKGLFGECTAYVPDFVGDGKIEIVDEVREAMRDRLDKLVYLLHESGESDRTISMNLGKLGVTMSRTTVNKIHRRLNLDKEEGF